MTSQNRNLTKLVTRLESGERLPAELYARTGKARIVGITGPPGVGKSSLIDRLIDELRRQGKTVGVVVIDPTSPISGGALLGDRLRMQRHSEDEGVFIRSLATRQHRGGLTDSTSQIVHALDAAGFDVVIVETVGTGQDEVEVAEVADSVVVVLMPELGDEIQRAKSGLMEIADVLVINKADLFGAPETSPDHHLGRTQWERPTIHTSAKNGAGITTLCGALDAHHAYLVASGELARRRDRAARAEVIRLLQSQLSVSILCTLEAPQAQTILTNVAKRKLDPYDAVQKLLVRILGSNNRSSKHVARSSR
ncbi:MAG TPA: methylmalonyl Co-A mutase-associated GTPase MeaB [Verrucomicrobiae bacterium]|nr:methylmalonyl Co-A mutase-associated GTPase MeaB [Verrucomicrobiae bacterium]